MDDIPITKKQLKYLKVLIEQLGFWDKRAAWLTQITGRPVKSLNDLSLGEARKAIGILVDEKQKRLTYTGRISVHYIDDGEDPNNEYYGGEDDWDFGDFNN